MSEQLEALRLADLYAERVYDYRRHASPETLHDMMVFRDAHEAEVRRLHAEIERLGNLCYDYLGELTALRAAIEPAEKPWQGLTEEEKSSLVEWAHPDIIEAIELRLRERNNG